METKHKEMINKAIRKVPTRLRDDAFQAGCVGLVVGLKSSVGAINPDGYVYSCIRNEVLKLMASLNATYSLDVKTLTKLLKYKRAKAYGLDPTSEGLTTANIKQMEKLLQHKRQ
jgi:DNA-directed RNA polymerase specialized sigma subunit